MVIIQNAEKNVEEVAVRRMEMISPLLDAGLDVAKISHLKKEISLKHQISQRSIGRYLENYKANGFEGLKPKSNTQKSAKLLSNWKEIVDEAILLRRELPSRSIPQIITILEMEGLANTGEIKRTT
jgi:hypothetical protein